MKKIFSVNLLVILFVAMLPYWHQNISAQQVTYNLTNLVCGETVNGENIHVDLRYPEAISSGSRSFTVDITGGNFGTVGNEFNIRPATSNISINDGEAFVESDGNQRMIIDSEYPVNGGSGDGWVATFENNLNNPLVNDQIFIINFRTSDLAAGDTVSIDSYITHSGNSIIQCGTININVVDDTQLNQRCGGNSNASFGTMDESKSEIPFELCLLETDEAVVREFNQKTQSKANQIGSDTTFDQTRVDGDGIYTSSYKIKSVDTVYIAAYSVAQDGSETLIGEKDLSGRQPQNSQEPDRPEGCALEDDGQPNVSCQKCIDAGGIWIAIGCVDPTPLGIMTRLVQTGIGVMGGVALVQLIIVGLYLQSGQEAKIAEGKKKLIATLTGIVVLVFSVLILRIIGVNVLDAVPGGFL